MLIPNLHLPNVAPVCIGAITFSSITVFAFGSAWPGSRRPLEQSREPKDCKSSEHETDDQPQEADWLTRRDLDRTVDQRRRGCKRASYTRNHELLAGHHIRGCISHRLLRQPQIGWL